MRVYWNIDPVDFGTKIKLLNKRREIAKKIEELIIEYCKSIDVRFRDQLPPVVNLQYQIAQLRRLVKMEIRRHAKKAYDRIAHIPYKMQTKTLADIQKWLTEFEKKVGG
jgi:hypothetical protein